MKTLVMILSLTSMSANAAGLNCLGDLQDGYEINICKNVIDLSKVKTINCLEDLEDGYQVLVCENAVNPSIRSKINCLNPQDGYELNICKKVPEPRSIVIIDCLGELEDGYQVLRCENVDVKAQQALRMRLN